MAGTAKDHEITLESVLCLLDRWRHLPAYQLERRVDVLFALFLPEVLEKHFGTSNVCLIPEFPIKKSLLRTDTTAQSINVDFLGIARESDGKERAYLVELKTDMASRREDQAEDLGRAVNAGLKELVEGVIEIARNAAHRHKKKYGHLLYLLSELDLVECQGDPLDVGGYEVVDRKEDWPCLELVYVQPKAPPKMTMIGFDDFAAKIEEDGSDIGRKFAGYLREWVDKAGERDPKDWSRS